MPFSKIRETKRGLAAPSQAEVERMMSAITRKTLKDFHPEQRAAYGSTFEELVRSIENAGAVDKRYGRGVLAKHTLSQAGLVAARHAARVTEGNRQQIRATYNATS